MEDKTVDQNQNHKVRRPRGAYLALSAAGICAILLFAFRPSPSRAKTESEDTSAIAVPVARVQREDLCKTLTVQAEFRPYTEVQLHAKVSGFLQNINVDLGDRVKAGQLLATLEVPELQDELKNAIAAEQKAQADYKNAHLTYRRLVTVNEAHPNLVAQQDLDTAEAKDNTAAAALAAAKAEREKYQTLSAYTKITAPFDGVITHRYADPGSLIQSGTASATQTMPLVRLSDNYRLRLDFPVSVDYVKDIQVGDPVDVRIDSLGRTLTGKISRFTDDVDETTRTMITEMEVENPKLEVIPGMYATVVLKLEQRPQALALPTEAIAAGKTNVYVVNANHIIEERAVTLGLETPTRYEVLAGLNEGDLVVIGNAAQVKPGQKAEPKVISQLAAR
jgi:RND family efflux transporter MFP subunit